MNYWAIINNVKVGPLTVEQLKACGLTVETLVWREGFDQWVAAGTVAEIASIFAPADAWAQYASGENTSIGQPQQVQQEAKPPCPNTYLAWAIIATIFCCIPFGIVSIIYAGQVSTKYNQGDYAGALKSSERAALWLIVAIVTGLIAVPFQIAMI